MQELYVSVKSFQDVRSLSGIASREEFYIGITDGHRRVNAKSLMGIFSLNMSRELTMLLDCSEEDSEAFRVKIGRFLID